MRVLVVLILMALSEAAFGARIELQPEAAASGPFVLLSDVAKIDGAGGAEAQKLGEVRLGLAPDSSVKVLTREYVGCRLKQEGFDSCTLAGAAEVRVMMAGEKAQREEAARASLRKHVAGLYGLKEGDVVVEAGEALWGPVGDAKEGAYGLKILEPSSTATPVPGVLGVVAELRRDGMEPMRLSFPMKVSLWKEVVVAEKNIGRGRAVMPADVAVERTLVGETGGEAVKGVSDVVGKKMLATVMKGSVITRGMVEDVPVVKRGDMVMAEVKGEGFSIRTWGKVKEEGRKGETIEVENPRSRSVFLARVIDEKTVEVLP